MKMIPSVGRELEVRAYNEESLDSRWDWMMMMMMMEEMHIHVKALSQRACDGVTSCVFVSWRDRFPTACMISSGSDSSVLGIMGALHHTGKIQRPKKAICSKGQPRNTAALKEDWHLIVSWSSNQLTNNTLKLGCATKDYFRKQWKMPVVMSFSPWWHLQMSCFVWPTI